MNPVLPDRSARRAYRLLTPILLLLIGSPFAHAQESGAITGTVVDTETGESLIGVNILVQGTRIGTSTDVHGAYRIADLEPGTYDLVVSYIGYTKKTVTGVEVEAGVTRTVDVRLVSESVEMDEVTVSARAIANTEAILLKDRQKAASMSNAISAEEMSRVGSGTASDAMKKVTGASVLDGSYVHVRGLGDRYVNTQLNGAPLPSADPNSNSVPLDLFPSGLLDNIVTRKTFTPDQPGNYTGGSVNIGTKSYPESFTLSLSSSVSHNTQVGIGDEFLTYEGGSAGTFAMNGDRHALPEELEDPDAEIPNIAEAWTDESKARRLDRLSRSFDEVMSPVRRSAPISQSYKASSGGRIDVLGRQLGVIGSVNYRRSASGYERGTSARYILSGEVAETDVLSPNFLLSDVSGTDEVLWGGMLTLDYKLLPRHTLKFSYIRNQSASSRARYQSGYFPRDLSEEAVYETRTLRYAERTMNTYQAQGDHHLGGRWGPTFEWNATRSFTAQEEPDLRFFTNNYTARSQGAATDTVYAIRPSIYPLPSRYFRDLEEENWTAQANLTVPFRGFSELRSTVKFGGSYEGKERAFRERRFRFEQDAISYEGDSEQFWSDRNVGMLEEESSERFFRFGNYVQEAMTRASSYDGEQALWAGYGMVDLQITPDLRLVAGARYETTQMTATSLDTTVDRGELDTHDVLPSANLIYSLTDRMNLRAAYGRTLARPTFRELAPYASFNFVGDYIFIGNPGLKRTLTDNLDLRWEWFMRPGELVAVSGFYKDFRNPIERVILNTNSEVGYQNVEEARVYGLELEVSKKLDQVSSLLEYVRVGANLTLTHSETTIAPSELEIIRAFDPDAPSTRPLQGQSPYVVNLDLSYANPNFGTEIGVFYHAFGERQMEVSLGGTPDLYEQPRHQVDVNVSQDLWAGFSLDASVSNMLGEKYVLSHTYKGRDYVSQSHPRGRSVSIGLSYDM